MLQFQEHGAVNSTVVSCQMLKGMSQLPVALVKARAKMTTPGAMKPMGAVRHTHKVASSSTIIFKTTDLTYELPNVRYA